jgi:hypothetical protein
MSLLAMSVLRACVRAYDVDLGSSHFGPCSQEGLLFFSCITTVAWKQAMVVLVCR